MLTGIGWVVGGRLWSVLVHRSSASWVAALSRSFSVGLRSWIGHKQRMIEFGSSSASRCIKCPDKRDFRHTAHKSNSTTTLLEDKCMLQGMPRIDIDLGKQGSSSFRSVECPMRVCSAAATQTQRFSSSPAAIPRQGVPAQVASASAMDLPRLIPV